jgi:hypothetical protein
MGTCSVQSNLGGCYFQPIKTDGSLGRKIPVLPQVVKVSKNYRCDDSEFDNDWAVLSLADDATEVTPFAPLDALSLRPVNLVGQTIVALAAQNHNFKRRATPTICTGVLRRVWQMNSGEHPNGSYGIGIDCSAGYGSSGGAVVLDREKTPTYLGLVSATQTDPRYDGKPYGDDNLTAGPLLYGEFYGTVTGM